MKWTSTITDNVTDVLAKIVAFTEQRRRVLTENITHVNTPGYQPCDLDVEGFAALMARAVEEHVRSDRLILCDTPTIHFEPGGGFETSPIVDAEAQRLLDTDRKAYVEHQVNKLAENLLNNKVARGLMERKRRRDLGR